MARCTCGRPAAGLRLSSALPRPPSETGAVLWGSGHGACASRSRKLKDPWSAEANTNMCLGRAEVADWKHQFRFLWNQNFLLEGTCSGDRRLCFYLGQCHGEGLRN